MVTSLGRLATTLAALTLVALSTVACGTNVRGSARIDKVRGLRRVAVMPFAVPRNAPPELSAALADELAAHLLNARFDIVERSAIDKILREQAFQLGDDVDPATVVRIGALAGADGVVLGQVTDYRDEATGDDSTTLGISIRCVQAETGSLIFTTSAAENAAAAFCGTEMNCLRDKMVTEIGMFVVDTTSSSATRPGVARSRSTEPAVTEGMHHGTRRRLCVPPRDRSRGHLRRRRRGSEARDGGRSRSALSSSSVESLDAIDEFRTFVQPVRHPVLTEFCRELTSIRQVDVEHAPLYPEAIEKLTRFVGGRRALFSSWGQYDKNQLAADAIHHGIEVRLRHHLNLKVEFAAKVGGAKKFGLAEALEHVGLTFEGTAHRAIDDARNVVRLLPWIFGRREIRRERRS